MHRLIAAIALAALALTCAGAQAAPADIASARLAIDRANADWLPAIKAKDAERLAAPYAPEGVFVLPDGRSLVGRAAVADFYRERFAGAARVVDGGIHRDGLAQAAGGLVVEWGHGGSTVIDAAGKTSSREAPYMTVWKRGANGRWAIVRNLAF